MALREIKELGRGAFGRVYLAYDDELNMQVAVKELLDPEADIDRFGREARVLTDQIKNHFVVNIYRYDLSAKQPYIVLEYCEGGSLRRMVGKSNWWSTAAMLLHAACGLMGIHSVNGFHRDIKPENLLIARDLRDQTPGNNTRVVKVADFGLARRPQTALPPMTQKPAGTEGYIAPEMYLPGAQFSAQCDIYSLGIVGIELMTGERSPELIASAAAPDELKQLLARMSSPWAWMRPATADLIIALARIVGPAPPPTPAPAPPPPAPLAAPAAAPARAEGMGDLGWLLLLGGGVAAAALALGAGNKKAWDDNVERYRGRDGRFKKG
jgi:serine/threonine protein kinase